MQKRPCKDELRKKFEKEYKIRSNGFDIVIKELKQDIYATAQNIKWFTERNKQYREKNIFVTNHKQFRTSVEVINSWAVTAVRNTTGIVH